MLAIILVILSKKNLWVTANIHDCCNITACFFNRTQVKTDNGYRKVNRPKPIGGGVAEYDKTAFKKVIPSHGIHVSILV